MLHDDNKNLDLPKTEHIKSIEHLLISIAKTNKYNVSGLVADITNTAPASLKLIGLRQALNIFDDQLLKTIIYYQQLNLYYNTHKFCGSCGNPTIRQTKNKFLICTNCKHEIYPHIAPSVIVRIHRDDEILMARGVNFPPNSWGLIAGFVEIGETLENAVKREVMEEVGIEIDNICYWGSQPWPFPTNSIMTGFTANYKSGKIIIDPDEIEQAGFYNRNNYPGVPATTYSIASHMIKQYLDSSGA